MGRDALQHEIEPKLNATQTLVATKTASGWQVMLFQNTPAQLHGRPDLVEQMTKELRDVLTTPGS